MALAVTAAVHAGGRAVDLAVTGTAGGHLYTLRRQVSEDGLTWFDSGGEPRFYVRGWRAFAGGQTGIDVDFPQNTYVKYTVTDGTESATSAVVAPVDLGADYILGTGSVAVGIPVIVADSPEQTHPAGSSVHKVIGRRDPSILGDLRQYPRFDLTVWTFGQSNRDWLGVLLDAYPVVTLSPRRPRDLTDVTAAAHLAVEDLRRWRPSTSSDVCRWDLACSQVGAPVAVRATSLNTDSHAGPVWNAPPDLEA